MTGFPDHHAMDHAMDHATSHHTKMAPNFLRSLENAECKVDPIVPLLINIAPRLRDIVAVRRLAFSAHDHKIAVADFKPALLRHEVLSRVGPVLTRSLGFDVEEAVAAARDAEDRHAFYEFRERVAVGRDAVVFLERVPVLIARVHATVRLRDPRFFHERVHVLDQPQGSRVFRQFSDFRLDRSIVVQSVVVEAPPAARPSIFELILGAALEIVLP